VAKPRGKKVRLGPTIFVGAKERSRIAQRTKEALAAAKARGRQLGNPDIGKRDREAADEHAEAAAPTLAMIPFSDAAPLLFSAMSEGPMGRFYDVNFILLRDGRERDEVPFLEAQDVADEIVLVKSLKEAAN
jgi:hypothetical protein